MLFGVPPVNRAWRSRPDSCVGPPLLLRVLNGAIGPPTVSDRRGIVVPLPRTASVCAASSRTALPRTASAWPASSRTESARVTVRRRIEHDRTARRSSGCPVPLARATRETTGRHRCHRIVGGPPPGGEPTAGGSGDSTGVDGRAEPPVRGLFHDSVESNITFCNTLHGSHSIAITRNGIRESFTYSEARFRGRWPATTGGGPFRHLPIGTPTIYDLENRQ